MAWRSSCTAIETCCTTPVFTGKGQRLIPLPEKLKQLWRI